MRRFSLATVPFREMSESNLAIIAREFKNRGFIEDEEEESDNGTARVMSTQSTIAKIHHVPKIQCRSLLVEAQRHIFCFNFAMALGNIRRF